MGEHRKGLYLNIGNQLGNQMGNKLGNRMGNKPGNQMGNQMVNLNKIEQTLVLLADS